MPRAEELLSQAEANRPRSRLIDIAFGSYERDAEVGGGILAGAVAFRVFLFIVPFVFFFVVAFGLAVDATGTSVTSAADKAGIAGLLATTIKNVGDQSVWSRLTILGISGFALVLGARNLVKVLTVIHVLIWRLPRVRVRRQARAVGLVILSVLGALVLAQLVSTLQDRSFPAWVFATSLFMLIPAGLWLVGLAQALPSPARGRMARPGPWGPAGRRRHRGPPHLHGRLHRTLLRAEVGDLRRHRRLAVPAAVGLRGRADPGRVPGHQRGRLAPDARAPAAAARRPEPAAARRVEPAVAVAALPGRASPGRAGRVRGSLARAEPRLLRPRRLTP